MKKYIAVLFATFLYATANAEDVTPDPEQWYLEAYGPMWADKPGERLEEILGNYADEVQTHSPDGATSRQNKADWLSTLMTEWLAEGWLNSELTGLKTDRINASTVSFKSSWLDHYEGAEDETSCGWYLADLLEGQWQFTAYAEIECAAHGL
jgi:hypothetical protein